MLVHAWHEALVDVPDADLEAVYRRAIKRHTGAFPLGTGDMLTAWGDLRHSRLFREIGAADADA